MVYLVYKNIIWYLVIYIIIIACWQHWLPWFFLTISPYGSSFKISHLEAARVHIELMNISFCWSCNTGGSMCRSSRANTTYEFVLVFPALLSMSSSSYLDALWDGRLMAIQLLFCGVLLLGFVQNSVQYPCFI